jgi:hypothetical protein
MIPLLAIPMLYLRGRTLAILAIALGVLSFGMQLLATAVDPMPDSAIKRPIRDHLLRADTTSVNPQSMDELVPYRTHPRGSYESTWASFNLGELVFGAGNPWSVLPIALWVIGGAVILSRVDGAGSPTGST